jgi:hypothetical protein
LYAGARGQVDIGDEKVDLAFDIQESGDRFLGVAGFPNDVSAAHEYMAHEFHQGHFVVQQEDCLHGGWPSRAFDPR